MLISNIESFLIFHHFLLVGLLASNMEELFLKCSKIDQNEINVSVNKTSSKLGEVNNNIFLNSEDKNPQDKVGKTPLHYAAEDGKFTVCKNIIDKIGELLFHLLINVTPSIEVNQRAIRTVFIT